MVKQQLYNSKQPVMFGRENANLVFAKKGTLYDQELSCPARPYVEVTKS